MEPTSLLKRRTPRGGGVSVNRTAGFEPGARDSVRRTRPWTIPFGRLGTTGRATATATTGWPPWRLRNCAAPVSRLANLRLARCPRFRPCSDIRGVTQPQPGASSASARRRGRAGGVEGGLSALFPMVKRAGASGVRCPRRVVAGCSSAWPAPTRTTHCRSHRIGGDVHCRDPPPGARGARAYL